MENLKYIRKQKNMSQEQLGQHLGFGKNTISQYENGIREPNLDTIKKIARIFNVSIDYLVGNNSENIDVLEQNNMGNINPERFETIKLINNLSDEDFACIKGYLSGILISKEEKQIALKKFSK